MTRRPYWVLSAAIVLFVVAVVVAGIKLLPALSRHYKVNDSGTGLMEYVPNEVRSDIKEGYLLRRDKKTYLSANLSRRVYICYELYSGPSTRDGFFEVYSDREQSDLCKRVGSKLIGPKVRLDTCSKDIGLLNGLVWYINRNLGPVPRTPTPTKTAKQIK